MKIFVLVLLALASLPVQAAGWNRYGSYDSYAQQRGQYQKNLCGVGVFHKNADRQMRQADPNCQDHDYGPYWDPYPVQTMIRNGQQMAYRARMREAYPPAPAHQPPAEYQPRADLEPSTTCARNFPQMAAKGRC